MSDMTRAQRPDLDALQARFALRVASCLSERSDALPQDIGERLRVARERSLARARQARPAAVQLTAQSRSSLLLGSPPSGWQRLASALPLVLLVLGLGLIQHLHDQAEIRAAAEVDAALLADDLPPEAYGDPGFVAFLQQPRP